MHTIRLLKRVTQKQFTNNLVLLQNNVKFNYQSISSLNVHRNTASTKTEPVLNTPTESARLTDKEYLIRLKNDPDRFGPVQEEEVIDEGDLEEEKHFTEQPSPAQKLQTKQYADIIKTLIKQRKIKEAIDVVEVRMLKEDKVKPENYLYNLLLGACGRVGYTKKAFKLYNQMKKRGLEVTGGTYTALFNACANSPWPEDGLKRALHLRNIMIEKRHEPNDTNYNAMIKAFGRCGDLTTAFAVVDEMCSKGFRIKDDTINFLLQACITDKEAGFRHALLVWRKLVNRKISPSVYTYNLMLRSIRDCGLGDIEVTQDVINKIVSGNKEALQLTSENGAAKLLSCNSENSDSDNNQCSAASSENETEGFIKENLEVNSVYDAQKEMDLQTTTSNSLEIKNLRPNLMAKVPHLGDLISLSEVKKAEERLLLVGGCSGFLENMKENNCTPDIKTFTQLLDSIPSTLAAESDLMSAMKKLKIKPDIDFYNMLIKKRSMRHDYENARAVLEMMYQRNYRPNLITYGVLSLSCKNKEEALELLDEMESKSYRLNIEILGAMLHQACYHMNFGYVLEIMEICLRKDVKPSKKFMETLDQFIKKCKELSNAKELKKSQEKKFGILKARHKNWVQEVELDETEDAHPWQQYQEGNEQNAKIYKWKDGTRFKPRHTSKFLVKTSTKHWK